MVQFFKFGFAFGSRSKGLVRIRDFCIRDNDFISGGVEVYWANVPSSRKGEAKEARERPLGERVRAATWASRAAMRDSW